MAHFLVLNVVSQYIGQKRKTLVEGTSSYQDCFPCQVRAWSPKSSKGNRYAPVLQGKVFVSDIKVSEKVLEKILFQEVAEVATHFLSLVTKYDQAPSYSGKLYNLQG